MVMRTRDARTTLLGIRGEPGTVTQPRDVGCGRTGIGGVLLSPRAGGRHLIARLTKIRRDATDAVQGVVSAGALRPSLPSS
jgi:hypothetical protein